MKKELARIEAKEAEAVKDPKVKALRVIDMLTCNENNKLLSVIYQIAHSASGICDNEHEEWQKITQELYENLSQLD